MATTLLPTGGMKGSSIVVTAPAGSTVTCSLGNLVKTATEKGGTWTFRNCGTGSWVVTAAQEGESISAVVSIQEKTQQMEYHITLVCHMLPSDFDWDAYGTEGVDFEIVDDINTLIPRDAWADAVNWKARLLKGGTLRPLAYGRVDIFAVGGGGGGGTLDGGGGGGGRTATEKNVTLLQGEPYAVVIGAGGQGTPADQRTAQAQSGGTSSFGRILSAEGGQGGYSGNSENAFGGGDGGSGGGSGASGSTAGGDGGFDGSSGFPASGSGGTGQNGSTEEFDDELTLQGNLYTYAGGGGGGVNTGYPGAGGAGGGGMGGSNKSGYSKVPTPGAANTGGGGGGSAGGSQYITGGAGGSGIVIIRNTRG